MVQSGGIEKSSWAVTLPHKMTGEALTSNQAGIIKSVINIIMRTESAPVKSTSLVEAFKKTIARVAQLNATAANKTASFTHHKNCGQRAASPYNTEGETERDASERAALRAAETVVAHHDAVLEYRAALAAKGASDAEIDEILSLARADMAGRKSIIKAAKAVKVEAK